MPAVQSTQTARHHIELRGVPRISLPKFAGDPLEWPKWIGLFRALIHEQPGLSNAEKIVHLKSAVTGLAQQTIEGMLYDGQLSAKALKTLQDRFGRSKDIVFANLSAFLPLKLAAETYGHSGSREVPSSPALCNNDTRVAGLHWKCHELRKSEAGSLEATCAAPT